jgi:SAM-dependent methyltransferase
VRAQTIRRRLEEIRSISDEARILEVGSGAHGLIFGFGGSNNGNFGVGVDPLAVDYKRLFPAWQRNTQTLAAIGEELPFADAAFDVVLSDNVIDHAEKPVKITEELARVLMPGGLLYFTVNVHHPIYELASKAHGVWNALGVRFEISPFADHTVHFTENEIKRVMRRLPINVLQENSTIEQTKAANRQSKSINAEEQLKRIFFKNAVYEMIAVRD